MNNVKISLRPSDFIGESSDWMFQSSQFWGRWKMPAINRSCLENPRAMFKDTAQDGWNPQKASETIPNGHKMAEVKHMPKISLSPFYIPSISPLYPHLQWVQFLVSIFRTKWHNTVDPKVFNTWRADNSMTCAFAAFFQWDNLKENPGALIHFCSK